MPSGGIGEYWRKYFGRVPIWTPVLAFYVLFTIAVTFPFILHPTRTLIAPLDGDVAGSIAKYEVLVHEHANPFTATHLNYVHYPDGIDTNVGVDRVSFLSVLYLWLASLVVGPIAAHSLESVFGYILTAFIAFLFVRRITKSAAAGMVAGFIFAFSPHMYSLARAEPTYTHMWLLILPVWAFWSLCIEGPSNIRRVLFAAWSILPAMFWTPYYMYHVLLVGGTCLAITLLLWRRRYHLRQLLTTLCIVGGMWVLTSVLYWFIGTHSPASHAPPRTLKDAYDQAAVPAMYLLPGYFSVWGRGIHTWISARIPQTYLINLYVGLSTLIVALVGVLFSWRQRKQGQKQDAVYIATVLATSVVLVCLMFSLAPRIHLLGFSIPTPNDAVVHVVPSLRAGQRLVMPMMGALSVLAGIGVYYILKQFSRPLRPLIFIGLLAVISLDLWGLPSQSATYIPRSAALTVLSRQPKAPVAQYQLGSMLGRIEQVPCILQDQYAMPLVNDCTLGRPDENPYVPPANLAAIDELTSCQQITLLGKQKVRYIIANRDENFRFLKCIHSFADATLLAQDDHYEVFTLDVR